MLKILETLEQQWATITGAIAFIAGVWMKRKPIGEAFHAAGRTLGAPFRFLGGPDRTAAAIDRFTVALQDIEKRFGGRLDEIVVSLKQSIAAVSASVAENDGKVRMMLEASTVPYFECDMGTGRCIWGNKALQELFRLSSSEILNSGWMASVHPADSESVYSQWMDTVMHWRPYRAQYRLLFGHTVIHVEATADVIPIPSGTPTKIWGRVTVLKTETAP